MTHPAAIALRQTSPALFVVRADVRDDYAVGPALLVRVDSRRGAGGLVHKYAAISLIDGELVADHKSVFEDSWGEVVPFE